MQFRIPKLILVLVLLLALVLTPIVSAENYQQNFPVDIKISCLDVNCSEIVNLTVVYPNSSTAIYNQPMTSLSGFVNFSYNLTSILGEYQYYSNDGFSDSFRITPSGAEPLTSGQGIMVFSSLAVILLLGICFLYGGFVSQSPFPKALFFSLGAIFFFTAILFTVTILYETVATSPTLVGGFETFLFVIKVLLSTAIISFAFIVIVILIKMFRRWRGFE